MFGLSRRKDEGSGKRIGVALIGEGYRRGYVRNLLGDRVKVKAEFVSNRRAYLLEEVCPEVVVLDCASEGINPFLSLPKLAELGGSPRVVALTDRSVSRVLDADALALLGADATADIRDARGVIEAVLDGGTQPPRDGRRALAVA
jgi:DNA-binding NarL/FixJ family response regulator